MPFSMYQKPTHYSVVSSDGYLSTGSGQKPESFLTLVMGWIASPQNSDIGVNHPGIVYPVVLPVY